MIAKLVCGSEKRIGDMEEWLLAGGSGRGRRREREFERDGLKRTIRIVSKLFRVSVRTDGASAYSARAVYQSQRSGK